MARSLGVASSKADIDEGTITGITTFNTAAAATVGFYGVTAVAQRAGSAQTAVSNSTMTNVSATGVDASVAGAFGFVSSTQINTVIDALSMLVPRVSSLITLTNELRAALVALGVITGAA